MLLGIASTKMMQIQKNFLPFSMDAPSGPPKSFDTCARPPRCSLILGRSCAISNNDSTTRTSDEPYRGRSAAAIVNTFDFNGSVPLLVCSTFVCSIMKIIPIVMLMWSSGELWCELRYTYHSTMKGLVASKVSNTCCYVIQRRPLWDSPSG